MKTKKERASWPMKDWEVRVIRDGSKTQARQVAKCKYKNCHLEMVNGILEIVNTKESEARTELLSPYGQPGDQLWGREAFAYSSNEEDESQCYYRATDSDNWDIEQWYPSTQMKQKSSRTTLEIVSVHAERLQDISNDDAEAEGCNGLHDFDCSEGSPASSSAHADQGCQCGNYFASEVYARLWKSINGPGSWDANPWVWVLEFKVV